VLKVKKKRESAKLIYYLAILNRSTRLSLATKFGKFEAKMNFETTPGLPTNDLIRFHRLSIACPDQEPIAQTYVPEIGPPLPDCSPEYSRASRMPNRRLARIGKQ
jgi:hypothetical protein